jgi:hypothetical protein
VPGEATQTGGVTRRVERQPLVAVHELVEHWMRRARLTQLTQ